jgi:hypothetical protein
MLNLAPHRFDPFHNGVDIYLNILTESEIHGPRSVSSLQPGNHLIPGKETQLVANIALQIGVKNVRKEHISYNAMTLPVALRERGP